MCHRVESASAIFAGARATSLESNPVSHRKRARTRHSGTIADRGASSDSTPNPLLLSKAGGTLNEFLTPPQEFFSTFPVCTQVLQKVRRSRDGLYPRVLRGTSRLDVVQLVGVFYGSGARPASLADHVHGLVTWSTSSTVRAHASANRGPVSTIKRTMAVSLSCSRSVRHKP